VSNQVIYSGSSSQDKVLRGETPVVVAPGRNTVQSSSAHVYTVPVGTEPSGDEPDGSLWVEYGLSEE